MVSDIVISATMWDRLYQHLIQVSAVNPHPSEEAAYLFASLNVSPFGLRFIVHDLLPAMHTDFDEQSSGHLRLKRSFVEKALKQCGKEGLSLIEVHSHPSDTTLATTFSENIDWPYYREAMPSYTFLLGKHFRFASMVVGQQSLDAFFFDPVAQQITPLQRLTVVGKGDRADRALSHIPTTSSLTSDTVPSQARYHRQELFFGKETQHKLSEITVAIVGLGGLGSFVVLELAHLGVGHLILVDPDIVEETNLNRLLGVDLSEIGEEKVHVFGKLLKRISPSIQLTPLALSLLTEQAVDYVKSADILVGCVDNDGARLILNEIAVRYLIPYIDGASGVMPLAQTTNELHVGGQVQVVLPGTRCLQCQNTIDLAQATLELKSRSEQSFDKARNYNTGVIAPSVISLNGVIASVQVTEVLQLLTGNITGNKKPSVTLYDALQGKLTPVPLRASKDGCPECGRTGMAGYGDLAPIRFAVDTPSLSVEEIKNDSLEEET